MESWLSEAGSDSGQPGTLTGNTDSSIPHAPTGGAARLRSPVHLSPRSLTGVPHDLEAPPEGAGGCGTGTRQMGAGRGPARRKAGGGEAALAGRAELKLLPPECVFPSDSNPFIRLRSLHASRAGQRGSGRASWPLGGRLPAQVLSEAPARLWPEEAQALTLRVSGSHCPEEARPLL